MQHKCNVMEATGQEPTRHEERRSPAISTPGAEAAGALEEARVEELWRRLEKASHLFTTLLNSTANAKLVRCLPNPTTPPPSLLLLCDCCLLV
jgi:hypothetical protein